MSDKIQRYRVREDAESRYMVKAGEGSWVGFTDHRIALAAQAEEHRKILINNDTDWANREAIRRKALEDKHAQELAEARGEGEPALLTFTWRDVCALREGCEPVRIHRDFKPSFLHLCDIADDCGVEIWPTHSVRRLNQNLYDKVVEEAERSNHHAGSAIDMNPVYDDVWYTSERMKDRDKMPSPVWKFLYNVMDDKVLRWGGAFHVNKDCVHFDDNLVLRDAAEWAKRVREVAALEADAEKETEGA